MCLAKPFGRRPNLELTNREAALWVDGEWERIRNKRVPAWAKNVGSRWWDGRKMVGRER